MSNDRADDVRPPFHALRQIWNALRLIFVVLKYTAAAIVVLVGLSTFFFNLMMIIVPLIAFHMGKPFGNTGIHPLFISLGATIFLIACVSLTWRDCRKTEKEDNRDRSVR
jgi:hypothetical protein